MRTISILTILLVWGLSAGQAQPRDPVKVLTITTKAGGTFTVEKTTGIDPRYYPLIRRLVSDGWSEQTVRAYFADKSTVFVPKALQLKAVSKPFSEKSAYAWVDTDESAVACRTFMAKYQKTLDRAGALYGVEPEMVAALMRCETRHGSITGDYHVFSTFASMTLLGDSDVVDSNLVRARRDLTAAATDSAGIEKKIGEFRARLARRSAWAYKELNNLMRMSGRGHIDIMTIYGSWAGAFGWCQFLPSSYLKLAVDGNGDRKIDLFNPSDAIFSVAHYLKESGYKTGNAQSVGRALHSYNNSSEYVSSIMGLAERLKKQGTPK